MFLPHPRVKVSIVGSLRDREVACSASDRQGSNFESCVWRTVSSQSSHHPQEVLLAQFSLYVHKGDLKPDSFHFITRRCAWNILNVFKALSIHQRSSATSNAGETHPPNRSVFINVFKELLKLLILKFSSIISGYNSCVIYCELHYSARCVTS